MAPDHGEVAKALRLAAVGRREYANSAEGQDREHLFGEASAFEAAASLVERPERRVGFLRACLPSWRWEENGVGLDLSGGQEAPDGR